MALDARMRFLRIGCIAGLSRCIAICPSFRVTAVGLVLAAISLVFSARAETEKEAFNRQNFSGWGGIVFRCLPDNDDDDLQKQLCTAAAAQARFLAATAKIPFQDLGSNTDYFYVAHAVNRLDGALVLETTIRSTRGYTRAIYMNLRATSFYSSAIDQGAERDNPESSPRSGTLVLWERDVIGSGGTDHDLGRGISDAFQTLLTDFFGTFVEGRN